MFSLLQLSVTYRPLVIFLMTAYFFYEMIQEFSHEQIEIEPAPEEPKRPRNNYLRFLPAEYQIEQNQSKSTVSSLKDIRVYISKVKKKKAFLNFLMVAIITILVELVFIYTQPN